MAGFDSDGFDQDGFDPDGFEFDGAPSGVSAAVTGTAADGLTEAEIVAGGETIILTLTGDTWVADDGTFAAVRQAIIDGMTSNRAEAGGWNAQVRDNEAVTAVVRTSATVVTITLTAAASYDINQSEIITITIPAAALVGAQAVQATPGINANADAGDNTRVLARNISRLLARPIVRDLTGSV